MKQAIILLCLALGACCQNPPKPEISPLVRAACVEPVPPSDDSFGATTYALTNNVGIYKKCRAAALGGGDGK